MAEREQTGPRYLALLRWATVGLPLVFLIAVNYLGHFVLFPLFHTAIGFALLAMLAAPAMYAFSRWVFSRVESAEARAFDRHQEMLLLNTLAAVAERPKKLDELLQTAVDGVVSATRSDGGLACVLDRSRQELRHVAYRDIPERLLGPLRKVKLEDDAIGAWVVSTGKPVRISDITADPRLGAKLAPSGFRSLVSLPLKSEGKVMGVMVLVSRAPNNFDSSQLQFLLTLGGQLGTAIERAQLQQQIADLAVLEERERIAREMHDGLSQVLGYINAKTSAISRLLGDGKVEEAEQEVSGLRQAAREVYGDVRQSILGLRLASSRPGRLMGSLREYAASFSNVGGIQVATEGMEDVGRHDLDAAVEIQAMRIVQEALANVRKHSGATRVRLAAKWERDWLRLSVEDDGRGFNPDGLASNSVRHFGLQTMRERAAGVGGRVSITSAPGQGTTVMLTVPTRARQR